MNNSCILPKVKRLILSFGCCLILGFSCTGLKYVPENEKLFTGSSLKITRDKNTRKSPAMMDDANEILRPKPNSSFKGIRFGLWWYYKTVGKKSKINQWLYKKLAQEPVYLSTVQPELVNKALNANLYNHGYFDSQSSFTVSESPKTAAIRYIIQLKPSYRIGKVNFPLGKDEWSEAVALTAPESMLKPGQRYRLQSLMNERIRIVNQLKEEGFYYLGENDLLFSADSGNGNRTVDLSIQANEEAPPSSFRRYRIGQVNVNADYQPGMTQKIEKRVIDSVNYFSELNYVKPEPILSSIFLKNGRIYSRKDQDLSYSRLMGLGIYKYVNIRLAPTDSTGRQPLLTANILLIPLPRKSLSVDFQAVSKSNNFIGPGIQFSLRNRNAFRGAELLVIGLRSSFETQFNGPYKGLFTYELNPKIELFVPRFMSPIRIRIRSLYVPKTRFMFDYSYLSRINYFNINSFKFSYGYKWKSSLPVDHDLGLFNVTYFNISNESDAFRQLIGSNPLLNRRFEKQLIAGLAYSFYFNQQVESDNRKPLYLNVNFESAGNALSAFKKIVQNQEPTSSQPLHLGKVNYSQFLKMDFDLRKYFFTGKKRQNSFAFRLIGAWGFPFGNSSTMPYIKQFFSGGAYSLRGFPAFSVGPGTYSPPSESKNLFFLQQGGELKLEFNVEYRFPLVSVVKGAWFVEAGNTWLNRTNPNIPGGKFTSSFYKELASNLGFGLRADVSFFVLRLDLGIPVTKPWLPEGNRWVLKNYDLTSPEWRRNNLILNLAFGYPF